MEFSQKIVVTGIIMPHNWDEGGRIIEIVPYTNNEDKLKGGNYAVL